MKTILEEKIQSFEIDSKSLGINYEKLIERYQEPHRYYHNLDHIIEMLDMIPFKSYDSLCAVAIIYAILYHDAIYSPISNVNEEESFALFVEEIPPYKRGSGITDKVEEMIFATIDHEYSKDSPSYVKAIIKADLDRFNLPFTEFWKHNLDILKEYGCFEYQKIKEGRIKFLNEYADKIGNIVGMQAKINCKYAAMFMETWKPSIAIYPGSFRPFHKGHLDVIEKASKIFDKVIISCGTNPDKPQGKAFIPQNVRLRFQVEQFEDDHIVDYISRKEYPVTIIRGIRDINDLTVEMTTYRHWLDAKPDLQLVNIFCDPALSHCSSSGINKTMAFYMRKGLKHPHLI